MKGDASLAQERAPFVAWLARARPKLEALVETARLIPLDQPASLSAFSRELAGHHVLDLYLQPRSDEGIAELVDAIVAIVEESRVG
jgi:hypothetical protein